jgi:hypothetical protein
MMEEIKEEIKKLLESNVNENTTYQNLWDIAKAVLMGEVIAISAYIKKTDTYQINNLRMHLTLQGKEEQTKPKSSRWREIIKIRAKINEIKTKQIIQSINETKSWFFVYINKINEPLAHMIKWRREKT